jgi:pyruvate,water dikinase
MDLWHVADYVRSVPVLRELVEQARGFADAQILLEPTPNEVKSEFGRRWAELMRRHGHQAQAGLDVQSRRWSEQPEFVFQQLRGYVALPADQTPDVLQQKRAQERAALVEECRRQLRNPLKRLVIMTLVRLGRGGIAQREFLKQGGVRLVGLIRQMLQEAGRRMVASGQLKHSDDIFFLDLSELESALVRDGYPDWVALTRTRRVEHDRLRQLQPPPVVIGPYNETAPTVDPSPNPATDCLIGVGVSPGTAVGRARVILSADNGERVLPGEILVAPFTDPGWTTHFLTAAGIVVDIGGLLSHGSVVAREYGIPAVVNVGAATRLITTGQMLRVDGARGSVEILNGAAEPDRVSTAETTLDVP